MASGSEGGTGSEVLGTSRCGRDTWGPPGAAALHQAQRLSYGRIFRTLSLPGEGKLGSRCLARTTLGCIRTIGRRTHLATRSFVVRRRA